MYHQACSCIVLKTGRFRSLNKFGWYQIWSDFTHLPVRGKVVVQDEEGWQNAKDHWYEYPPEHVTEALSSDGPPQPTTHLLNGFSLNIWNRFSPVLLLLDGYQPAWAGHRLQILISLFWLLPSTHRKNHKAVFYFKEIKIMRKFEIIYVYIEFIEPLYGLNTPKV